MSDSPHRFHPRAAKLLPLLHDGMMGAISLVAALYLRVSVGGIVQHQSYLLFACTGFALILVVLLLSERVERRLWRFVSLNDLMVLTRLSTLAILVFYVLLFQFTRLENFPRSVMAIHWMTLMLLLMAPRIIWRVLHDRTLIDKLRGDGRMRTPVLLVGAGREAELFIRESASNRDFPYKVVAVVDDDPANQGRELHHVRIYGTIGETGYIIQKLERKQRKPQRIILTRDTFSKETLEGLLSAAEENNVSLARMPRISALSSGDPNAMQVQPVAVEDILGRPEQQLDRDSMRLLVAGKQVLVTGAGGSIGSELVRQIASYKPKMIVLYEASEYNLYRCDLALGEVAPDVVRVAVLGDVRDAAQLDYVMRTYAPQCVFHAAALKHVPLCEYNPDQAVLTNILGTQQVVDACIANYVPLMVQVSTDKAVNPISVMGATKRVAELYCQARAQQSGTAITRFVTVRFGNVLNSAGSVVPLFTRQIARGGPVTITHPEMTRYFMTIAEAVELVLQAAALDGTSAIDSHARAHIYVLEMGEPVAIEALARQMIRLSGLKPGVDIAITYTGLRAGEKLYEELFHANEILEKTTHPSIRLAAAREVMSTTISPAIAAVISAARAHDTEAIKTALRVLVPEFTPND
jgi:FlaA1/EpsC-like NDP-sugar epimerase